MSRKQLRWSLILLTVFALVLAACQPAATPTPTPRPTQEPTEVEEEVVATEVLEEEVEATELAEALDEAATELAEEVEPTEEMMAEEEAVATEGVEVAMAPTEAEEEMAPTEEVMVDEEAQATDMAEVAEALDAAATELAEEVEPTEEMMVEEEVVATEPIEEALEEVATELAEEVEPTEEMMMTEEAMVTEAPMDMAEDMAGTVMISPDEEVIIGLAAGLSGEGIAPLGIDIQRGAELALVDRPTVTVDGVEFTVALDSQDDQCSAEGGQAVANRFAADASIVGVVGPMCSSACRAAAPIFDAAGYTTISPSCTAPDLTTSGFTSFNRAVVGDAFQGRIAADFIYNNLGITSIATIHDGSTYGEGLVTVVAERFQELGGEVVAQDAINVGDTDFRALLEDIAQAEPELIYFGGFAAEAARLIQQREDAGLEDVPFMGADGVRTTETTELAGEAAAEGVYASSAIPASSDELTAFIDTYVETYGEEPPAPYHANAYDAVNILLDAVEATGTVDEAGDLVIDRAALAEYVRSFSDFEGLTGTLNAEGTGETSTADIGIYQVQDGEFVLLFIGEIVDGEVVIEEAQAEEVAPAADEEMAATEEAMEEEMMATEEMVAEEEEAMEPTAEATAS